MNLRCQVGLAAAMLLMVPTLALAQRGSRIAGMPTATRGRAVSANHVVVHPGANHGTGNRTASTSATRNSNDSFGFGGDPLSIQDLLNPFPGFGFNFEHLSALNQDLGIKALIDPATKPAWLLPRGC